jgi:hypothetical protein
VTSYPAPTGQCVLYDELSVPSGLTIPDFSTIGSVELKSQPFALTLTAPDNTTTAILATTAGYIKVNLIGPASPPILGPGTFALSGTAGPDVAAFKATTQFPENLVWSNIGNLMSPPRTGVTITWTGGGSGNLNIFGNATVFNTADPTQNRGKSFSCLVPATGSSPFLIPVDGILSKLPVPQGANEIGAGSLGIAVGGGSQFNATLTSGKSLDGSIFGFGEAFVNAVTWK